MSYACIHVPGLVAAQRPALVACAAAFSPVSEPGPERIVFDVRGLGSLFGAPREVAEAIAGKLADAELRGSIAIAANPHAAVTAAKGFRGITVIDPGDEARRLAPLPLMVLEPEEELAETLAAWGIHTLGDLSKLPEAGLAERLGAGAVRLHRLARGVDPGPLVVAEEEPRFEAEMDLEHGLDSLEPLAFVLGRLLNEVCAQLAFQGLAASELSLRLKLDDGTEHTRVLRLPFASIDHATFLKLLQYDLAAHPPEASILHVWLRAQPAPRRRVQGGLFLPAAPEPEKLELTLTRLAAIVGEGNVGSPELLDTHRPDAFRMNHFVATKAQRDRGATAIAEAPTAIRLYRPPLPAKVLPPFGPPRRISAPGISGDIVAYAGPWRSSGDWWNGDPWGRDEWDVALGTGAIYRLHREGTDRWFVDGNYD